MSKDSPTRVAQREALAPLIASAEGILFSEALAAEGAVMFPKANWALRGSCRSDGAAIKSGRSRNWLKTVNPDSVRTRPPAARLRNFPGGPQRVRAGRRRAGYNVMSSPRSRFTRAINSSSL
jgi:hypothetical protein